MIQNEHNDANTLACQRVCQVFQSSMRCSDGISGRVTYSVPTLPIPLTLTAVQIPTGTVQQVCAHGKSESGEERERAGQRRRHGGSILKKI